MDISLRPVIKDRIFETQLVSHHRLNPTTEGRWGRNPMRRCARISNEAFGPHPPHQVRREIQNTNSPPPMVRGWRFFVAAAAAANRHRRRRHYPGYYLPIWYVGRFGGSPVFVAYIRQYLAPYPYLGGGAARPYLSVPPETNSRVSP